MKLLISTAVAVVLLVCVNSAFGVDPHEHSKVVCYWNATSFERAGPGKFQVDDLRPALSLCTHLIYGFAGINAANFEVVPLNPNLDTGAGYGFYRLVTQLKRQFPELKVYLSIGGNADPYEETHKYLTVTETSEARNKFVRSVDRLLQDYDFDGVDLAWQFPPVKVKKNRGTFGSLWHGIKKTFGYGKFKDEKEQEHRDGFTIMVRDLKTQLRAKNKALTLTVLPHINSSIYYDARLLTPNLEAIHVFAFDQSNPERTPKKADYPAPIYESYGREDTDNVDSQTRYWLENGTPGGKIVVGIPAFARTWKLTADSEAAGVPPVTADGPGAEGPHTGIAGLLSYAEVCSRLTEHAVGRLRRVNDPSKKYGAYAYQPYNSGTGTDGIWVGFEDPETAGNKALYAKAKGLGGVAIYDLSLDDFRGVCNGDKFPIVKGAKFKL
ncbi:chitinase-like protein Idgf4 [Nasonia vitripennis]|uniref:GH18 domain-containing protein n=1 Tax=Nasonia vitripennis TaxID=7425 RepID=A0A7M7G1W5_NASVI|nr:chitinase-like protein Idgf4 [Nasonia vitripennis]XP_032456020.1 chitinase-like protein Idgf4 [Nasonia vitripennis]XP_032456021.1 chitinase-like protein Idgf4 [Nasonia vitripennis]